MRTLREGVRLAALRAYGRTLGRSAGEAPALRRVLVVRPDHLGDLLLSVPAIRHIKQSLPDCHLGLLIGPWNLEAAAGIAYVNEILTLEFPWFDREGKRGRFYPYRVALREAKRLQGWDAAVVLRHDHW